MSNTTNNVTGSKTTVAEINSRRIAFNAVMNNLQPFYRNKSGIIPLELLYVDERYQGLRMHGKLNRLINRWDINKLTPITLVAHPEENRFAIVDGQGRYLAAQKLGLQDLEAVILTNAPADKEERLKFEASCFIGQDTEVEKVNPSEKHLARVIMGEPVATTLDDYLEKYDVKFVSSKGNRAEKILGSYSEAYEIAKVHGGVCLDFCFRVIEQCRWCQEANGYSQHTMRALKNVWAAHPCHRQEIEKYLSVELKHISPNLFKANARASYPMRNDEVSTCLYLEDMVCKGLGLERGIIVDGDKKYKVVAA